MFRIIVEETIEELLGRENIAVLDNSIHVRMEHARSYTIHCLKANILIITAAVVRQVVPTPICLYSNTLL